MLAGLLLPRVRISGDVGLGYTRLRVSNPWFLVKMDLRRKVYVAKVLFIRVYPLKKSKKKRDTDTPESITPTEKEPPHEDLGPSEPIEETPYEEAEVIAEPSKKPRKHIPRRFRIKFGKYIKRRRKRDKTDADGIPKEFIWRERALILMIVRRLVSSLVRLIKMPRFDRLKAEIDIATPDPALTGILFGAVYQLRAIHNPPRRVIMVRSDFENDRPEFDLSCRLSISPIMVIYESFYIIIRLPWLRIYKVYREIRKQRKQAEASDGNGTQGDEHS